MTKVSKHVPCCDPFDCKATSSELVGSHHKVLESVASQEVYTLCTGCIKKGYQPKNLNPPATKGLM